MAIGDIRIVQELNDWGIKASIIITDTLSNGQLIVKADVIGGNGNYRYDWGKGYENYSGFMICPVKDTLIRLITSDYWMKISGENEQTSIPDTAYLDIKIKGNGYSACDFITNNDKELIRTYLNEDGSKYSISASNKTLVFKQINGKGSSSNYVGGFEVSVKDWNKLPEIVNRLKKQLELIPTKTMNH